MTLASWLTSMRVSITRIGLIIVLSTASVGFLIGRLDSDKFTGITMAIVSFYYVAKGQMNLPKK